LIREIREKKPNADWVSSYPVNQLTAILTSLGDTALCIACQYGNVQTVCAIIKALGVAEARREAVLQLGDGWTPLHLAARSGKVETVRAVIEVLGPAEAGRVAALPNKDGWTPLQLAARSGKVETVRAIIEALGIDAESALKSSSVLHHDKKMWTQNIIREVVKDTFFQRLLNNERLTDVQKQLCVKYKYILNDALFCQYGSDMAVLEEAINQETSLGRILWTHGDPPGFFRPKEPKTIPEIRMRIQELERIDEEEKESAKQMWEEEWNSDFGL